MYVNHVSLKFNFVYLYMHNLCVSNMCKQYTNIRRIIQHAGVNVTTCARLWVIQFVCTITLLPLCPGYSVEHVFMSLFKMMLFVVNNWDIISITKFCKFSWRWCTAVTSLLWYIHNLHCFLKSLVWLGSSYCCGCYGTIVVQSLIIAITYQCLQ